MVAPAGAARLVTACGGLIDALNKNQARIQEKSKLSARISPDRQLSLARHYFLQAGGRCPVARLFSLITQYGMSSARGHSQPKSAAVDAPASRCGARRCTT